MYRNRTTKGDEKMYISEELDINGHVTAYTLNSVNPEELKKLILGSDKVMDASINYALEEGTDGKVQG